MVRDDVCGSPRLERTQMRYKSSCSLVPSTVSGTNGTTDVMRYELAPF